MIVNMAGSATEEQINHVVARIKEFGYQAHLIRGEERVVIGIVGKSERHRSELEALRSAPGVEELVAISHPFKLASRDVRPEGTVIDLGKGVTVGGKDVVVAAGPCAVESAAQIETIAAQVAQAGAKLLRGGAFKPRSSPYSFQGLGEEGLQLMRKAADKNGLLVVSEVMDPSQIAVMLPYVDVLQVGARNMQNYHLLRGLGEVDKPVLLKRGMAATIEELLLSAEYIMAGGNYKVILCERGIRTFDTLFAQHAGYRRDSRDQEPFASADFRGPVARHGAAGQSCADGARGRRGGRRRVDHRGASGSGARAVRWRAVAVSGSVLAAHDGNSRDRARGWAARGVIVAMPPREELTH